MQEKKALILDTNFIVENSNLTDVIKKLENDYVIYIPQMSIEERIAQKTREKMIAYTEADKLQSKYSKIISINYLCSQDELRQIIKSAVQESYNQSFPDRIINYSTDSDSFKRIIQRASEKLPPFSSAKDSSDKGFKDCIIWYSILDYFKEQGETNVLFITNDQGFIKNKDYLIAEFQNETGKSIEFKSNSFYSELIESGDNVEAKPDEPLKTEVPNIEALREKIASIVEDIRVVEYYNSFGDECWERTFSTSKLFDKDYIQLVFEGLDSAINKHFLENSIKATEVLEYDNRIENGNIEIPIKALEELKKIYDEIKSRYPHYLCPLFEATAKILNSNYVEPKQYSWEEELPF